MRRAHSVRRITRHQHRPSQLMLVSMIDIFTVLVTFLLMTAVFSRTVILELKLPPANAQYTEPPPGLQLEVTVRKDALQVVKSKFPDKTDATILLEPDTAYDTVVQTMDRIRVLEVNAGLNVLQYELFPDISIGDAPVMAADAAPQTPAPVPAAAGKP